MFKKIPLLALCLILAAGAGFAQQIATSKMEGKVLDSGAPLPGVSVEATSPKMVGKATAVTDGDGAYRLFSLPSGTYEVVFSLQGFKTLIRQNIIVQMSTTVSLNVTLDQAAIEEQVTVIGQSPLIDVKSTVKGQTMTKEVFMSLPRSRNFDGLLSTVPGVQYESNTGGLSVDGATGTENMWYMDGTDITRRPHRHPRPERRHGDGRRGQGHRVGLQRRIRRLDGRRRQRHHPLRRQCVPRRHHGLLQRQRHPDAGQVPRVPPLEPLRRRPGRVRQRRRPVLGRRQEPRRLQAVRRRLQPGRLHPQGPPVVLRLLQPPVFPDRTPTAGSCRRRPTTPPPATTSTTRTSSGTAR